MPDICDLILNDHSTLRRGFADLEDRRSAGADELQAAWQPLAALLELHAAAEEEAFYPSLLGRGDDSDDETRDAIKDHNAIRDAVAAASAATPGEDTWWAAVNEARKQNDDHMDEEEHGALPDYRSNTDADTRARIGARFQAFKDQHPGARGVDRSDKDPDTYVSEHEGR